MRRFLVNPFAFLIVPVYFLINVGSVFADVNLTPNPPSQGINPTANPQAVLGNIISIIFVVATLVVLFFLIIGAFNWITSGGDKEKVAKARGTIINALIGLAVLALSFVIWNVAGQVVGVNTTRLSLPSLNDNTK